VAAERERSRPGAVAPEGRLQADWQLAISLTGLERKGLWIIAKS